MGELCITTSPSYANCLVREAGHSYCIALFHLWCVCNIRSFQRFYWMFHNSNRILYHKKKIWNPSRHYFKLLSLLRELRDTLRYEQCIALLTTRGTSNTCKHKSCSSERPTQHAHLSELGFKSRAASPQISFAVRVPVLNALQLISGRLCSKIIYICAIVVRSALEYSWRPSVWNAFLNSRELLCYILRNPSCCFQQVYIRLAIEW